jgi:hypothetical protein
MASKRQFEIGEEVHLKGIVRATWPNEGLLTVEITASVARLRFTVIADSEGIENLLVKGTDAVGTMI